MIRSDAFRHAPLALAGVLALAAVLAAGHAEAADLRLSFEGFKAPTGSVMAAVYDSEEAYASGKAPVAAERIALSGDRPAVVTLSGLKPGRYAVKAFHDVDGDGKMAVNPFGQPTEPFAFSNNAKADMGPASWTAAAFEISEAGATQAIRID